MTIVKGPSMALNIAAGTDLAQDQQPQIGEPAILKAYSER